MEQIPFLSLSYQHNQVRTEVLEAVARTYDRNWFVLGRELEAFEAAFARYVDTAFCLGVGNGLDALTLALHACGIGMGDEVIVPAHTYIATWLAVSKRGARIVPVEPDERTFNIDVTKVEQAITTKTKAILPVHLYGQACDMTTLDRIARHHNLLIIEDFAQAHGAKWLNKMAGSYGTINATSFYPTKNLAALGDGGAITTFDASKAEFVRRQRNYGFAQKNVSSEQGVNSRLDELQAAVLNVKLNRLEKWNEERRALASQYLEQLEGVGDLVLPLSDKEAFHVYHLFVVRTRHRDSLKTYLHDRGIETMVHYPIPPHLQGAYRGLGYKAGDFPLTEAIAETALSLPLWPGMTEHDTSRVCDVMKSYF